MAESAGIDPGVEPQTDAGLAGDDPGYRAAVIDLLGVISYGEITAFERLAEDAKLAPTMQDKVALATMAATELGKVAPLHQRISELGGDPFEAMSPFNRAIDEFHRHTAPSDWLEGLVKAFVGDGLADDFYREIAGFLRSPDRELVLDVLHESRFEEFSAEEIRAAIAADPKVANRLSMWARRLSGEALSQAQRVAMAHTDLVALVMVGAGDQAANLFKRLTSAHSARMTSVGLNN
jgi:hypothetical protein